MQTKQYDFLRGGGEMGDRMRAFNWAETTVGSPDTWPSTLRTTVNILLNSKFPMFLLWGEEYIQFYNDAYRPSFGSDGKHPLALGQKARECWKEAWDILQPLLDQVRLGGEAVWKEDEYVPIYRNGKIEDTYWTFSYSPVLNDAGKVAAVLSTCVETTEKVDSLKKLNEHKDELAFAIEATELGTWDLNPVTGRFTANSRLKEWFGLKPEDEIPLSLAVNVITEQDRERVSNAIAWAMDYNSGGRYEIIYTIVHPQTNRRRIVLAKGRAWFMPDKTAYRFNGTLQDITEQKLAETAQREAELRFKNVSDTSPTGLWLSDREGALIYLNKTLVDWTGMPYESLLGAGWANAIIDEDRENATGIFLKAVSARAHYKTEFRIRKRDKSIVWCRAEGDPLYDAGNYSGYAGYCMDIHESKSVSEKIAESRQQLLNSFEASPVAIATIDKHKLRFTMANSFYGELVGRKPSEIEGRSLLEAIPEIQGQGFDKQLEEVINTGIAYTSKEVSVNVMRNGKPETIYVDLVYQPQYDADRHIAGILVVATDVTEQVKVRRSLEESERFTRHIFYNSPVAKLVYVGADMVLREANEAMLHIFGRDESILNKPIMETVPELQQTDLFQKYTRVLQTGESHFEYAQGILLIKNGEQYQGYYDYIYKPLRNAQDQIYGVVCTAVDVTKEVTSRKRIEAAEASLRSAIDLAQLATWKVDVVNGTIEYSERLQQWLGIESASLNVANSPRIHPKDRERVGKSMQAALQPGLGVFDEIYTIVHAVTNEERIIHSSGRAVFDEKGTPLSISGTAQDVTLQQELQKALEIKVQKRTEEMAVMNEELEMSNEDLRRSNEELSQYAYIASHDLQEPLRKIRVFSGLLNESGNTAELNAGYLKKINRSAERMSLLIRDLLEFSRLLKSDKMKSPVDLNKIVQEVINDFELLIEEKQAVLSVGELPVVEAVQLQMNQLFYNLVGNALKFVKPGVKPRIAIACEKVKAKDIDMSLRRQAAGKTYYRISIADNGIGFDSRYADQIFEVFKRLNEREAYPGSGIGLALCRRITVNHSGYLYSESEPGKGSVFHILLPC